MTLQPARQLPLPASFLVLTVSGETGMVYMDGYVDQLCECQVMVVVFIRKSEQSNMQERDLPLARSAAVSRSYS